MKMKTFQADTMQEVLSLVKDEMGPDAVILKSRRATRRVNGKMQPCFEVTAALDESLFARPEPSSRAAGSSIPRTDVNSDSVESGAQSPQPARSSTAVRSPAASLGNRVAEGLRETQARSRTATSSGKPGSPQNPPGMYDWKGSLRRVNEDGSTEGHKSASEIGNTAPSSPASPRPGGLASAGSGSLLELLRSELREMKDKVDLPARELQALKLEIKGLLESASHRNLQATASEGLPRPGTAARSSGRGDGAFGDSGRRSIPTEWNGLQACLSEMDLEPELVSELLREAGNRRGTRIEAPLGSPEAADHDLHLLATCMSERIRVSGGIRLMPGRPTTVALVGPTGVGKTTTLAKLAALAKMQQGKKVGIISADSFRMGANEQLELFGRTAGIPVKPVFSPADVAQAQRDFADRDLILVDTAGRSHTHLEMWRELQGLLRCLRPDEIHLVLAAPTRLREMRHQYSLYRDLGASSLIFTKLDECLSLGCLYNLARRVEAPLSYLCHGQVIPDHIQLARAETLSAAFANVAKAAVNIPMAV